MADDRGRQFDILDKAVAARATELYNRQYIARQDYDSWTRDYNQLKSYALANSDNSYVARQWRDEEPRYANVPNWLQGKIRVANTSNYDTSISVSGKNSSCGCGSQIPKFDFTPSTYVPGNGGQIPSRGGSSYTFAGFPGSLGDNARNLFSPNSVPFFNTPDSGQNKLVKESDILTGIIVALVVGALLWGIHFVTKKKVSLA